MVLRGPSGGDVAGHVAQNRARESEAQQLESELSTRSPALRVARTSVTLAAVQAAIPAERALVEIASYRPLGDTKRRYIAYVLEHTGDPRWVDLGTEEAIDAQVIRVRKAFADPKLDPSAAARELDKTVMAPVRALLGATRDILLSPDGQLNVVPFAALVDDQGKFLVESYTITYLTTGRDLLRIAAPPAVTSQRALVVAAPTFGSTDEDGGVDQRRSFDLSDTFWPPLPGTVEEGTALKKLFGADAVVMGDAANESALKRVRGPLVLHVATHGFFLKDEEPSEDAPPTPAAAENPLLRSGLALSGANRLASGKDDGVLTALEASGLDLAGTQVVVLSACETGLGEVHNGEGVYGLRRAFVIAGAESQLISLWEVSDNSTRDLMLGYYDRLARGAGRTEALRAAQLALLGSKDYRHPFFWAAFIQSGDWKPVRGSLTPAPATARLPPVARSARGCACDASGSPSGTLVLAVVVVLVLALRRRRTVTLAAMSIALASSAHAAPASVAMPGSGLELAAMDMQGWTASDASMGGKTWDRIARVGGVQLLLNPVRGPTSCVLTINLRYLDMLKGTRVVTGGYLPPDWYPETLELASGTGVTVMACAELPEGTVTAIIRYTGTAWPADAATIRPLLSAYARAAAWGEASKGLRPPAARVVKLPTTGLELDLSPSWHEHLVNRIDVVARYEVGKPLLMIGVMTDVIPPPLTFGKAKPAPRKKSVADSCAFWEDGVRIKNDPDEELVPRPAFAPHSWHARAKLVLDPEGDRYTVCRDTKDGRWLAIVQYKGAWTDAGLADATAILEQIAARP